MSLLSISPIDGRYEEETKELKPYFSEFGLIRYKVLLEIEYLLALGSYTKIFKPINKIKELKNIYLNFSLDDAKNIKEIEKTTQHDTKAIEYFLREKFKLLNLEYLIPFIHFALTSEDVTNLAYRLIWINALKNIYLPELNKLQDNLKILTKKYSDIPLLALTHGQPATPTTIGKEINVFVKRLERQITQLNKQKITGKLNGATGTFAAHQIAYPETDWLDFSQHFIKFFGLEPNLLTTQAEPGDSLAESYQNIFRINTILIDLSKDFWLYISRSIFVQEKNESEIGSSTMPHKINPINFENAEGNLGLANSYFNHLSATLPISRMQRDLSGSTIIRNQGIPLAHSLLSIKQIIKGLKKIKIDEEKIDEELADHWEILAEPIQTCLRKCGDTEAYEKIKELTRGQKINQENIKKIINNTNLPDREKQTLLNLTPQNYLGLAKKLSTI